MHLILKNRPTLSLPVFRSTFICNSRCWNCLSQILLRVTFLSSWLSWRTVFSDFTFNSAIFNTYYGTVILTMWYIHSFLLYKAMLWSWQTVGHMASQLPLVPFKWNRKMSKMSIGFELETCDLWPERSSDTVFAAGSLMNSTVTLSGCCYFKCYVSETLMTKKIVSKVQSWMK